MFPAESFLSPVVLRVPRHEAGKLSSGEAVEWPRFLGLEDERIWICIYTRMYIIFNIYIIWHVFIIYTYLYIVCIHSLGCFLFLGMFFCVHQMGILKFLSVGCRFLDSNRLVENDISQIAIENGHLVRECSHEIAGDFFHSLLYVYQRVLYNRCGVKFSVIPSP